jgi:hypothetical protein
MLLGPTKFRKESVPAQRLLAKGMLGGSTVLGSLALSMQTLTSVCGLRNWISGCQNCSQSLTAESTECSLSTSIGGLIRIVSF